MLIITISIFVFVTLGVMGLYWLMFRPTSAATERLKSLGAAEGSTTSAGLGLNAALVRVGEELRTVHPDMSEEFEITNLEIRVGRERDEALRNLSERCGIDDLKSLVAM